MTTKFKAGDKVVRTQPYYGFESAFMQKGGVYIVSRYYGNTLLLEGSDGLFNYVNFELAEPQFDNMKGIFKNMKGMFSNMKFRVNSPEHSKEIQEALFEMGYGWKSYGKQIMFTEEATKHNWLYTTQDGYTWLGNDGYQDVICSQEFVVETTKSYKIVPVEIPKPEVITIDGKTYDKETVLKRLAELETVQ